MTSISIFAQMPDAHFSFDNACQAEDEIGVFTNNMTIGSPICDCGPSGNAMVFDGIDDIVVLDDGLKTVFRSDFTISFYFWGNNAADDYNIIAVKKPDCVDLDSTMHVKFRPGPSILEFDFTKNIGQRLNFSAPVSNDHCWHHVVIVKSGTEYSFYLDEVFLRTLDLGTDMEMAEASSFFIGNTECQGGGGEQLFDGIIDELKIYDAVLSSNEIEGLNEFPDQIITESTTIFEGESIQINTGGTCATSFAWSNPADLDDPLSLDPIATPMVSTEYIFLVDHPTCTTRDTILINVIDAQNLDCGNLLLPKAFTPNNDGLNDTYGISNDFIVDAIDYFEIYDRWGTKLFTTNQLTARWDGTFKGSQLTTGSFAYKIKYTCRSQEFLKAGNFSILR